MSVFVPKRYLVTGGAGFIGANFVQGLLTAQDWPGGKPSRVVVLDALAYAGDRFNLENLEDHPAFRFIKGDIGNRELVSDLLHEEGIDTVVHFAAESHVDRSIDSPGAFIQTNVTGTFQLLEAVRAMSVDSASFRFLHVSTDEVFGSLGLDDPAFTEKTPYAPNSPYAASKAASDMLVRSYFHTYGLPVITTNCSNNYGPRQFPEKLIPLMILNAWEEKPLPIYGNGANVRDWLHVDDHGRGIMHALLRGKIGETYNFGGEAERSNIEMVDTICAVLDRRRPRQKGRHADLKEFVADRPGHDQRYAMSIAKVRQELDWAPLRTLADGLEETVDWYLSNLDWCQAISARKYQRQRLGQAGTG